MNREASDVWYLYPKSLLTLVCGIKRKKWLLSFSHHSLFSFISRFRYLKPKGSTCCIHTQTWLYHLQLHIIVMIYHRRDISFWFGDCTSHLSGGPVYRHWPTDTFSRFCKPVVIQVEARARSVLLILCYPMYKTYQSSSTRRPSPPPTIINNNGHGWQQSMSSWQLIKHWQTTCAWWWHNGCEWQLQEWWWW